MDASKRRDRDEHIERFELRGKIGEGGMGVVYQARDTRLGRNVALKFLPSHLGTDSTARERFLREARTASALEHPNVAPLLEIGDTDEGRPFLVMPYYEGPTLSEKIQAGSISTDEALGLAMQIARGLHAAHREGIVHRDVKPANVLLPDDRTVKLTDFGLAKWLDRSGITRTNSVLGTFAYMSPEHARGAEVDRRTDLWSLGVLLYEMLARERPFRGPYQEALLYQIVHEEPPDLRDQRPDLPEGVICLVEDLLEKDPADRPESAEQVAERLSDLKVHLGSDASSETADRPRIDSKRLSRWVRSRVEEAMSLFPELPSYHDQTCYLALPASLGYAIPDSLLNAEEGPSARDDRTYPVCSAARWIAVGESDSVDAVLERLRKADTTEADPYLAYDRCGLRSALRRCG